MWIVRLAVQSLVDQFARDVGIRAPRLVERAVSVGAWKPSWKQVSAVSGGRRRSGLPQGRMLSADRRTAQSTAGAWADFTRERSLVRNQPRPSHSQAVSRRPDRNNGGRDQVVCPCLPDRGGRWTGARRRQLRNSRSAPPGRGAAFRPDALRSRSGADRPRGCTVEPPRRVGPRPPPRWCAACAPSRSA